MSATDTLFPNLSARAEGLNISLSHIRGVLSALEVLDEHLLQKAELESFGALVFALQSFVATASDHASAIDRLSLQFPIEVRHV